MTFLEAALEILRREGRPLHFKELTERAMSKKLLTFVGRTPELTMQTQLTAAVKKSPGNPFVRVKPGVFGLLRYPEISPEEREEERENERRGARKEQNGASDETPARSAEEPTERRRRRGAASEAASDTSDREGRGRRRRRGGKGRGRAEEEVRPASPAPANGAPAEAPDGDGGDVADESSDEPAIGIGGLSAEARAAALAETGVLEGDDEMSAEDEDADETVEGRGAGAAGQFEDSTADPPGGEHRSEIRGDSSDESSDDDADLDDDDDLGGEAAEEGAAFTGAEGGSAPAAGSEELGGRRRRRRRRRRRGEPGFGAESRPGGAGDDIGRGGETAAEGPASSGGAGAGLTPPNASGEAEGGAEISASGEGEGGAPVRRILTPVDAAIEVLRGQAPGRGVHVRQIADTAVRRRLIHGEPNEAWRVIRTALAAEPKERLRSGARPRVRAAGSGLFALARRPPDGELERAEQVFADARRALRERTMAALERRIAELPAGAFEALARVLLQREGFGPTTFVKRVDGTIYVEALRGRGSRPSKCLIALRPGATSAGRRAIGELRAGIRARGQDEGVLMLAGRLADEALAEWRQPGPPLEIADGAALAETCVRHGVGVLTSTVSVDFVDGDFFAELAEG